MATTKKTASTAAAIQQRLDKLKSRDPERTVPNTPQLPDANVDRENEEPMADAEQVQQLADWVSNRKDELQDKFNNMSEGAQEGNSGQAVQEKIEALDNAESSIGDEMTEEDLQNVIDELEGTGIRVPRLKGGKSPKARKTSKVPDKSDGEIEAPPVAKEIKIDEVLSQEEGLKRFKELDRLVLTGMTQSLIGARALREMEQGQYYIFGGFKTIAEYGMKIMKLAESTVYQHVKAGRVAKLIDDSTDCRVKPVNEAQLRPLLNVEDDEKVIEIWNTASTLYGEGGLTEKAVAKAKQEVLKQEPPKALAVTIKQLTEKLRDAVRSCWDACPEDERAALLGDVFLFAKVLAEELDENDISPGLAAILVRIDLKPEDDEDDKTVDEPEPAPPHESDETAPAHEPALPRRSPPVRGRLPEPEPDKPEPAPVPAKKAKTKPVPSKAKAKAKAKKPAKDGGHRAKFDWDRVNWALSNADIASVWSLRLDTVRVTRTRKKAGPAKTADSDLYAKALAAEKAKSLADA